MSAMRWELGLASDEAKPVAQSGHASLVSAAAPLSVSCTPATADHRDDDLLFLFYEDIHGSEMEKGRFVGAPAAM